MTTPDVQLSDLTSAATLPASPRSGPSHKIGGGAITGGIVGAIFLVGAAIALFLWLRSRRRRPILPTSWEFVEQDPPLTVLAGGQTVLALDRPVSRSVVETQDAMLSKIICECRRSEGRADRTGSDGSTAGPGVAVETQVSAVAERVTLVEAQPRMRSPADDSEQPPGYTPELVATRPEIAGSLGSVQTVIG
ncbi:hypothetical protein GGX14DRAFT_660602 [Mycena pura]|uniref:Uncharacterized protein n=1 Tax=Mycena pura TaxID=153505 RepID=A0AAD6V212_9AGAR|nr:hypothetical protein GGX14DRAFT_660602 [Mycena pura]